MLSKEKKEELCLLAYPSTIESKSASFKCTTALYACKMQAAENTQAMRSFICSDSKMCSAFVSRLLRKRKRHKEKEKVLLS